MHTHALQVTNQQPQTTVGVLTEQELFCYETFADGKHLLRSVLLPLDVTAQGDLLAFLWHNDVQTVWLMPSTRWSRTLTRSWFASRERQWVVLPRCAPQEPERLFSVLLWPTDTRHLAGRQLLMVFPEAAGWAWNVVDATSLLATLTYLERVVGRPVSDGPLSLVGQLLTDLVSSVPSPPFEQTVSGEVHASAISSEKVHRSLSWMRPLTRAEQRARYVHCYTHLSLELEACLQLHLPAGDCTSSARGRAYDGSQPGIWRVQAERAGSVFDGKYLPSCLDATWMSTPQVECCRAIGYRVQVQEGVVWSGSQRSLQPWAQTLWHAAELVARPSARFKHAEGRANTAASIIQLIHLGLAQLSPEQPESPWYRREWWQHIRGGSRAVLFAHLARLVKRGVRPVLLHGERFWIVSDDPRPLTAIPGLLNGPRWSGYRAGYTVPLPLARDVQHIFHRETSPEQAVELLDALAHEERHPAE